MACREFKDLMMGYLDNELDDSQKQSFLDHIQKCPDCSAELDDFKNLKKITDDVQFYEPEDKLWQQYWGNVYNRTERGIGWIIFSISSICLLIYAGFKIIESIVKDEQIDLLLKIGLFAFIVSIAILLVSILRERIFIRKKERYKDVRR